ncbi:diguanylate cyclase (GGDEF) domain-containing protein [Actinoplanes derwentensis]|uniref:Diguanylate cyclase (GGDEF) domain-containing protein n=2 Tax=Actinoplanes derwentensis TaxID=113562 RepID=A0A1H1S4W1_9ACTN|nr:diguanylate cyclase (GGDEF) domain-containing protein [Actinoplanes derwentensis]
MLCLTAGTAAAAGYALLPSDGAWHLVAYPIIALSCVIAVVAGVRRHRPNQPAVWYSFAAGLGAWLANTVIDQLTATAPWSQLSAGFLIAGYPLLGHALFGLIRGRVRSGDRTTGIDAGIVATSLAVLFWTLVAGDDSLSLLQLLVAAGDIALFALISLLVTTPGAHTASYRLLLTALGLTVFSDVLLMIVPFEPGGPADVIFVLANVLSAAAALHPSMRRLTVPLPQPPGFVRPRLALLTAAILLAPIVSLHQGATGRIADDWLPLGVGSIVLFLLVSARMAGLVLRVEQQARHLSVLVNEDPLTGVANRRRWDERLRTAMDRSAATGEPLVVALLDLDHFKRYNDTHGHQAGDELLTDAATAWLSGLRGDDLLARYGGEEFCVMLTGRTVAEALLIVEHLQTLTPDGQTFSAGLTRWDGRQTAQELLEHADRLLYDSKRSGRARVTAGRPLADAA